MNPYERMVIEDLAICHYMGKWKEAKRIAFSRHRDFMMNGSEERSARIAQAYPEGYEQSFDFWMEVRRYYLELGGEYRHQLLPISQAHYSDPDCLLHKRMTA